MGQNLSKTFTSKVKKTELAEFLGSKGWRLGESARLPPMWPGFKSWRRRHMWLEFVVGSLPCSKRFFCGYSGFPVSAKTNISKFQFDQESGRRETTLWMCYLQIIIYLFIYKHRACELTAHYARKNAEMNLISTTTVGLKLSNDKFIYGILVVTPNDLA